jgi:membrane-associated phospholipid phosphatase
MRSLTMENRSERIIPFTFITILYIGVTYLFYTKSRVGLHDNVMKLLIIIDLLVFVATVITFFYKVSVHALAMWGLLGIILPLNKVSEEHILLLPTLGVILIAGLVMSSRLQLRAHTPREIRIGAMVGFATSFAAMIIFF